MYIFTIETTEKLWITKVHRCIILFYIILKASHKLPIYNVWPNMVTQHNLVQFPWFWIASFSLTFRRARSPDKSQLCGGRQMAVQDHRLWSETHQVSQRHPGCETTPTVAVDGTRTPAEPAPHNQGSWRLQLQHHPTGNHPGRLRLQSESLGGGLWGDYWQS